MKYFQIAIVLVAVLVLVLVYRVSLTKDIFRSSGSVDSNLESTILNTAKREEISGQYTWEKIQVSQRRREGIKILELTITQNPESKYTKIRSLFDILKMDYGNNPEVRKSFDGFGLRIIGIGIESLWEKF